MVGSPDVMCLLGAFGSGGDSHQHLKNSGGRSDGRKFYQPDVRKFCIFLNLFAKFRPHWVMDLI